ncbi:MAG: Ig-like domain-containing protein, partial [Muribaculaceae bacterium]|nr:Ig-like domain-containing protein [Muribaculaceae bacterium]
MPSQVTGYYGITMDGTGGKVSDEHGNVDKIIFSIQFPLQATDVIFTISNGRDDWGAKMGDGSIIPLLDPHVWYTNRDNAIVVFDLATPYPSNSPGFLVYRGPEASFNIKPDDGDAPILPASMSGHLAYTVSGYGATIDEHGQVNKVIATIPYPVQPADVIFTISDDPSHWGVHMPEGSIIPLRQPELLQVNRDNAVVLFTMDKYYPSNSPCVLVYRSAEAKVNIKVAEEESDFIPVKDVYGYPKQLITGIPVNLSDTITDPFMATNKGIRWSVKSGPATINGDEVTANAGGNIILTAKVIGGLDGGTKDYLKDVTIPVIQNFITIDSDPNPRMELIVNEINHTIAVEAHSLCGLITYQWNRALVDASGSIGSFAPITGATANIYSIPTDIALGSYVYNCTISCRGCSSTVSTNCRVDVVKRLRGISITNKVNSMKVEERIQMTVEMIPNDAPRQQIVWSTTDPTVIQVTNEGVIVGVYSGTARITAATATGEFVDSMTVTIAPHIDVSNITGILTRMDTDTDVRLSGTVQPSNATNKDITWSLVDAGGTGMTLVNGVLHATKPGVARVRASIPNGANRLETYTQDTKIEVVRKFVPVTDVTLGVGSVQAGTFVDLNPQVAPADASKRMVVLSIISAGSTGAYIRNNILHTDRAGTISIRATVTGGGANQSNYTKTISLTLSNEFIPVERINGMPTVFQDLDSPLPLTGVVKPDNASVKAITYKLINPSKAGATLDSAGVLHVEKEPVDRWWKLNPNPTPPNYYDQWIPAVDDYVIVEARVVGGLGNGRDFTSRFNISFELPAAPNIFIPLEDLKQIYPSINRAKRPILMNRMEKTPWNATPGQITNDPVRDSDGGGGVCITFQPYTGSAWHWYDAFGVELGEDYDWTLREGYYIYPTEDTTLRMNIAAQNATADHRTLTRTERVTFLPEYIPVKNIRNIPSSVPANATVMLAPELETLYQIKSRTTAIYDLDIPSYTDVTWRVKSAGTTGASITSGNKLTFTGTGKCTITASVAQGTHEAYTWYDKTFSAVAYTQDFEITVSANESATSSPIVTLKLADDRTVEIK